MARDLAALLRFYGRFVDALKAENAQLRDERDGLVEALAQIDRRLADEREQRHQEAMDKWARRYDDLNGRPESDEDH